ALVAGGRTAGPAMTTAVAISVQRDRQRTRRIRSWDTRATSVHGKDEPRSTSLSQTAQISPSGHRAVTLREGPARDAGRPRSAVGPAPLIVTSPIPRLRA